MQARTYAHLLAIARRWSRRPDEADDLVQDALLEGVRAGRVDGSGITDVQWLAGVIRNRAKLAARSAVRRKTRDADWQALRVTPWGRRIRPTSAPS